MSQILIELGCEDITLLRMGGEKVFSVEEIRKITQLFLKIESAGSGLNRYGCTLSRYLKKFDYETNKLPKFLARIRTGNEEEIRFLTDHDSKAGFMASQKIEDEDALGIISRQIEFDGNLTTQRISIHRIYESTELEKLLLKTFELGLDKSLFLGEENNSNFYIKFLNEDDGENIQISSITEFLENVRKLGRKGLQIQRYKGLGEMNPKQLFETTMNPETRSLIKVQIEDAIAADNMFTMLMGEDVAPRRAFIEDNALNVSFLDA